MFAAIRKEAKNARTRGKSVFKFRFGLNSCGIGAAWLGCVKKTIATITATKISVKFAFCIVKLFLNDSTQLILTK